MSEAFIYDAIRTPRGKGKKDGSLHEVKPISLLSGVLRELQSRNQFDTAAVDDVVMGVLDREFAAVDAESRIDISAGRGRVFSPFSGWFFRRPAAWAASLREYGHDLHVATWRKDLGPTVFDLFDSNNQLVEWDDRVDGGAASAARFTW